ncbi:PilZ domain-containing protein [Cellulomonas sp. P22]|uniref:PilZ domain-containing protein n=1 Tax=Cellulomonas sp. P22 TaxID=3373189 RepID=UPI0037B3C0A2
MHDLAPCKVYDDGGTVVVGYVRLFDRDMLTIGTEDIVRGLEPGTDVNVEVLDEVRGECLYAGYVSRVAPDGLEVADVALVSTLQKREVVRVGTHVACTGTVLARWRDPHADAVVEPAANHPAADDGADDGADDAPQPGATPEPEHGNDDEGRLVGSTIAFTILDISAHGMRVLAQTRLEHGQRIRFLYEELPEPILLDAVVVRMQESRTGTHYGCRFLGLTMRETDALFRHVLHTQGVQRRERMRL